MTPPSLVAPPATNVRVRIGRHLDEHLSVSLDTGPAGPLRSCADVLHSGRPRPTAEADQLAAEALRHYPGCLVAAVLRTDGLVLTRSRTRTRTEPTLWLVHRPAFLRPDQLPFLVGSFLHAALGAGSDWRLPAQGCAPSEDRLTLSIHQPPDGPPDGPSDGPGSWPVSLLIRSASRRASEAASS